MAKNDGVMHSLTTKVPPRDFLAVKILAGKNGVTESAYLRMLITSTIDVVTTEVPEEELIRLKSATLHHRKPKTLWQKLRKYIKRK